jgi:hypothetical protein
MAYLVPQGGKQRKRLWDSGFNAGGRWQLGADVTGTPDTASSRRVRKRRGINGIDDDDETGHR